MPFLGEEDAGTTNVNSPVLAFLDGKPTSDMGSMSSFMDLTVVLGKKQLFRGGRKGSKRRESTLSEPFDVRPSPWCNRLELSA